MKFLTRVLCVVLVLTAVAGVLTACGEDKPVVVEPVGDDNVIIITTNPATDDIMTFPLIIALNSAEIPWSKIEGYRHTKDSDTTATFEVICTDDKSAELKVEFDAEANVVKKADLVYGSKSVSILTDDDMVLMEILKEIEKD